MQKINTNCSPRRPKLWLALLSCFEYSQLPLMFYVFIEEVVIVVPLSSFVFVMYFLELVCTISCFALSFSKLGLLLGSLGFLYFVGLLGLLALLYLYHFACVVCFALLCLGALHALLESLTLRALLASLALTAVLALLALTASLALTDRFACFDCIACFA